MNKKIIFVIVLTLVFGLSTYITQDEMIALGGSSSVDRLVSPNPFSQWLALGVFVLSVSYSLFVHIDNRLLRYLLKTTVVGASVILLAISHHQFIDSGRRNALVDQWFLFPVSRISYDPNASLAHVSYSVGTVFIDLCVNEVERHRIVVFPWFFGPQPSQVAAALEALGVEENKSECGIRL